MTTGMMMVPFVLRRRIRSLRMHTAPPLYDLKDVHQTYQLLSKQWQHTTSQQEQQVRLERVTHENYPHAVVSKIILNRPKANAMGCVFLDQLSHTLDILLQPTQPDSNSTTTQHATTRCIVLTSELPRVFSAGADLKERASMSPEQAADFVTRLRTTFQRLASCPIPVLAAMEGVAVGGGLELALAADMRIAGYKATFGFPETTLAIVPGAGGTQRLPRLVGIARAKDLILTGRRIDAPTALQYGLVEYMVEEGQAEAKAIEMAWEIAKNGPVAIMAAKEAIDLGMEAESMSAALEIERQCYQRVIPTTDRLEGLEAFRQGRQPVYTGK